MTGKLQEIHNVLSEYVPEAYAHIKGSAQYADLEGEVLFYPFWSGTMVFLHVSGLPYSESACSANICAFHIHANGMCSGTPKMPFADAGTHYNPTDCPHPAHAGDLTPLFSNHGIAIQLMYTERFTPEEVLGRTAIIHLKPDDFTTQPSGNAGEMIACGEIVTYSD